MKKYKVKSFEYANDVVEYVKTQLEDIMNNDLCEDCPYKDTDCPGGLWCDK